MEGYLKRLKDMERWAESLHHNGQLTRMDLWDVQYRAREAEIWLDQERSR
jgi:hypothetical protein